MTIQNQTVKKILIAPDKFKGSLTSARAAMAIQEGFEDFCAIAGKPRSDYEFRRVEIADGGDGSLEVLRKNMAEPKIVDVQVHDPLGKLVVSQILIYGNNGEKSAFIEMAKVSGLEMLHKEERNPLCTSTYGMGEAIRAAAGIGVGSIALSIGGSATNDGGAGMLQALGYKFYDVEGNELEIPICGKDLQRIAAVAMPDTKEVCSRNILEGITLKVICDVTNPLLGPDGATAVYGPQKGAGSEALLQLEAGLANYAAVAEKCLGISPESKEFPGAGAAGGVGYAGLAFLGAQLVPGWKFFAQITSLEELVQWADIVITGEGSLDSQSLSGKVVSGVLNLADKYNKDVVIFCGANKLTGEEERRLTCFSISSLGYPLETCMENAGSLLRQLVCKSIPKLK